ncbi:hypothetical protein ACTJI8_06955 [Microbacterium sp. 22303]|uniref:hypothetical protein n=1 Tax=Microbacterium sp. 22303 TaxID=3453905 RepID=UPI003F84A8B7
MSTPLPPGYFDPRPLTDPVDSGAVAAFARQQRAQHPTSGGTIVGIVIAAVVMAILVVPVMFVIAMGIGLTIGSAVGHGAGASAGAAIGGFGMLVLIGGMGTGAGLLIARAQRDRRIAQYRIACFAAANGMSYIGTIADPPLPGMIFGHGSGRATTDAVRGTQPRFVEFGNYRYTTGSGKDAHTHQWGYIAVKLDVPLPHIVLDALGNNALGSSLPASFDKHQRLSLEGDFDRYFTLYCPAGYETDALYLFTPDVMVRFMDSAALLDVEIVDDWLFLYTQRPVSTLDPNSWGWLFGAVAAVLGKLDQWERWRDDRLRLGAPADATAPALASSADAVGVVSPSPGPTAGHALPFAAPVNLLTPPPPDVAPPGQRLRRRGPWVTLAIVFGVVLGVPVIFISALGVITLLVVGR